MPAVSAADQNRIDVYELVIRRVCGPDDTGVGKLPKRVIYLIRATDDRAGDPSLASTQTVMLSAAVQDALTRRLANLHVPVKWVNSFGDVKLDAPKGQPRGGGAIVTLGNVIPRGDGSVQVAASIYFSGTGAGGRTYLLKRGRDGWTIFGTTGGAWIS